MSRPKSKRKVVEGDILVLTGYLVVGENGHMSLTRTSPTLMGGQLGMQVEVRIPKTLFQFRLPKVEIEMDEANSMQPPIQVRAKHALDKL